MVKSTECIVGGATAEGQNDERQRTVTKRDGNASDFLSNQAAATPQDEPAVGSPGQPESIHTQALYAQVVEPGNLQRALKQVRRNQGAPGIDGMTVDELPEYFKHYWLDIRAQLDAGTYRPQPVLRVEISKGDGKTRPLGIPTVEDRFIQQATAQVVSAQWDRIFTATATDSVRSARPIKPCAKCRRTFAQVTAGWWIWTCKASSTGSIRTG